ncbi:MAG: hypothetical protein Q9191_005746 [Dirinaria sp. TL-2023a]
MGSEIRLRPCTRPACKSRPDDPTTGSCCDASTTKASCLPTSNINAPEPQTDHRSGYLEQNQYLVRHQSLVPSQIDIERGTVEQHAVVHISGMTCTGCERKLQSVLSSIAGVRNVKTSLVLGKAEFDVDAGLSITEVALMLERKTDFKCVVPREGHQLEVIMPKRPSSRTVRLGTTVLAPEKDSAMVTQGLAGPGYPPGVDRIEIIDGNGRAWKAKTDNNNLRKCLTCKAFAPKGNRHNARIMYNPRVVGARDLLEKEFGAPLSLAPLSSNHLTATAKDHLHQTLYMTILSAALTIPVLVMAWAPLPPRKVAFESSSLVLATLVQCLIAGPFYPKALKALLFSGMIEMDLLIVISTTAAYVYSVVAFVYDIKGQPLPTGGFFETSTLLVTLITCGRLASAYSRRKAADSVSIQALQPSTALLSEDGDERIIDIRAFQYGDLFKVPSDSVIPTDGTVVAGRTEIDESMITGEAIPVPKSIGSQITAGSVNGPGPVLARLTKLPVDNTISRIARMVDEARLSRPKVQETADRVASYFVPCILAVTLAIFAIWVAVGIALRHSSNSDAIVTATTYALAALIVSCPCAIGLAVPMVIVIASGVGAKNGVIFKSTEAIDKSRNASHVVFDKTGTLTQGKFVVVEEIYPADDRNRAASIALQLTLRSKHPVASALAAHLESYNNIPLKLTNVSSVIGKGMEANFEGQLVRGGSPFYVDAAEDFQVQRLQSEGLTVFCIRHGSAIVAIYGLRDSLRTDSAAVVSALQARGLSVSIVSGDSTTAVERLATELHVPLSHAKGQCAPEDKARYITLLSATTTQHRSKAPTVTTIFCGDGSNDAVALAQADIGIYMAGGTEMAKNAADVVLTQPALGGLLAAIDLSRASMRRVYFNFIWSFVYNLFAILLAAGAFVTVRIAPAYAGLGELVSVLPVILVAMQLRWMRFRST